MLYVCFVLKIIFISAIALTSFHGTGQGYNGHQDSVILDSTDHIKSNAVCTDSAVTEKTSDQECNDLNTASSFFAIMTSDSNPRTEEVRKDIGLM